MKMNKKKIITVLLSLLAGGLLITFGLYFFWAFPHAMVRLRGFRAPMLFEYDALTGSYSYSMEVLKGFFQEYIPAYFEQFNKNLFSPSEKLFAMEYPLYDMQIIKFIRIFFLAILGIFIILKAFVSKMSKKALIVPFILLIVVDFVFGVWSSVQCVRCVYGAELGIKDASIFSDGDQYYNRAMYNVTIDIWRCMLTNWSFLLIDAVTLVMILMGNKIANVKLIGKYAFLIPGILATLVVCIYVGCNIWRLGNNIFGMELFSLIIFAVAYYLIGWLLLRKEGMQTMQIVGVGNVEVEETEEEVVLDDETEDEAPADEE